MHTNGAVRKARSTEEQMVKIFREAGKALVAEVTKEHGISDQASYGWCQRYGTLRPADVQPLRQLKHQNMRLILPSERTISTERISRRWRRRSRIPTAGNTWGFRRRRHDYQGGRHRALISAADLILVRRLPRRTPRTIIQQIMDSSVLQIVSHWL